ncbi:hemagglutinin repeat-containing protein [Caballeronia sp. LZ034LL]|uniref:hemagglutinin repeat-containing protein n=1 Tax=Caballeronia sp. LZ034LL TaxID=3038567 RepID=UPI00285EDFED|nr:hemagglutinin repeat-containing protein [Caballeronia sp. LZ034LL]MDR5835910.1 hemagglutinin repeat-containing protein [Caballeronia sp. LZ034LL]
MPCDGLLNSEPAGRHDSSSSHSDSSETQTIHRGSTVNAGGSAAFVATERNLNIAGSSISASAVLPAAKNQVNVVNTTNTASTRKSSSSKSASVGVSVGSNGLGISAAMANAHGDANSDAVIQNASHVTGANSVAIVSGGEQAGLVAGDGGFDVSVKGNTALTGAVIAGADDAAKNSLSTGSLTFADVGNHSHYSANSIGGSVGLSPGPGSDKAVGPASVPGSGVPVSMIGQHGSGDQSAVSADTVHIADKDRQTQDVASLSRDMTNTNGTVASTPDVNEILNKQADTMQAAQAASQVMALSIGAYADMTRDSALEDAEAAQALGDLDAVQAHLDTAESWDEGGLNMIRALGWPRLG